MLRSEQGKSNQETMEIKEAWNNLGLDDIRTHALAILVRCSTNWAMKANIGKEVDYEFLFPRERTEMFWIIWVGQLVETSLYWLCCPIFASRLSIVL